MCGAHTKIFKRGVCGILEDYLNQTALYRPCTGTDERGQPVFGTASSVFCRRQEKITHNIGAQNLTAVTRHVYYLETAVRTGDTLDGYIVTAVECWADLDGDIAGYKAEVAR